MRAGSQFAKDGITRGCASAWHIHSLITCVRRNREMEEVMEEGCEV